jgi:diadenosine tetraphosphatase ApaH/serine/threonine PP2A family protein phosphatase
LAAIQPIVWTLAEAGPAIDQGTLAQLRVAVISDVHSNLPALEAVLGEIAAAELEEIWCLGDVVGYGSEPDACSELIRERCEVCLAGNHDLAVLGELPIAAFSGAAAEAVRWTRAHASERTLEFLGELEPAGERAGIGLFHASPRDPVWEYVLSSEQADACFDVQPKRICLIGHSHIALCFSRPEGAQAGDVRGAPSGDGTLLELASGTWLLNPGSVGQPRDGDPRAAWMELDTAAQSARFHRVSYDLEKAAEAIVRAGLPKHLGDRLRAGT